MSTEHPLKVWRKGQKKPLTQTALGELVGIGASQVSQIENGERGCSLEVALKIHDVTGKKVPLESLIFKREAA